MKMCSVRTGKVLVFAPPKICLHQAEKKARLDAQESLEAKWEKTCYKYDHSGYVKASTLIQRKLESRSSNILKSEVSENSGIVLDYDPKFVQESINSYLDREFLMSGPSSAPIDSTLKLGILGSFDGIQREYETVNFESQMLLNSNNLEQKYIRHKSSSEKSQFSTCDEDTHCLSEDDVYTQGCTRGSVIDNDDVGNNSLSSSTKRIQMAPMELSTSSNISPAILPHSSSDFKQKQDEDDTSILEQQRAVKTQSNVLHKLRCSLPQISDKLTYLAECNKLNKLVNLCIIVLQVNPIKEIQMKSGRNKGQYIPMSSIIVADVSKSLFKLTLWRQASCWSERMIPGDIIIATAIRIESWKDEIIGQTTFHSCFYNLHQPVKPLSCDWLQLVSQERLDQLIKQARQIYGHLFRNTRPAARQEVKFTIISEMQNNTLVHFRGLLRKVGLVTKQAADDTYQFGNRRLPKITVVFAESREKEIYVNLWGRQAKWLEDWRRTEGTVWELQYLTAKHDASSGAMVLHTTPKSTKMKLSENSKQAKALLSLFGDFPGEVKAFKSIKDLYEAKYSGLAEINGYISAIVFSSGTNEVLDIQSSQDVDDLNDWCPHLTYIGCALCLQPLQQDKNQIYGQCSYCVNHKLNYSYKLARFYRNCKVRFNDAERRIEVDVKHSSACKLFNKIESNQLVRPNSYKMVEFIERVRELVSCRTERRIILFCLTDLDENSFVVSRSFTLMDI